MDKLREILHRRNISVPDFAEAIGVAARTAYRYLSGERLPERDVWARIIEWSDEEMTWEDYGGLERRTAA